MRRVIVDFKKLNKDILDLLVTKYPDGYDDDHIITFKNSLNEIVECVEVKTDDTIYLVKVSKRLVAAMEDHDLEDNEDLEENVDAELDLDEIKDEEE
jgi:DNA-directed RNA polymerase subunit delta